MGCGSCSFSIEAEQSIRESSPDSIWTEGPLSEPEKPSWMPHPHPSLYASLRNSFTPGRPVM